MRLTLLGTGDSAGVPQVGCSCPTCERHTEEGRERTRFSLLVENEGKTLLIDASPDLRTQLLRENVDTLDGVVLTHGHYDHYSGLGNLYRTLGEVEVYGAPNVLDYVLDDKYSYLRIFERHDVEPFEEFEFAGLKVRLVPVHHPPLETYGVVVTDPDSGAKLSITGDTSREIPEDSLEAMESPDLVVADAFASTDVIDRKISDDGYSFADKHMTYEGALDLADEIDADETALVHLSHFFRHERDAMGEDGDTYVL
ncbi:MBL fold metallo-hydrolase [Halorutilales archaeon Cl-col2-1]